MRGFASSAPSVTSVERVAARARTRGVGVVDREALLLDGVDEVDLGTVEVGDAHPVHDHGHAVEVGGHVAVEGALVEEELVAEARAATGLHGDPQGQVVTTLLLEEALHLAGGDSGEVDLVGAALSRLDLLGHLITPGVSGTACLNGRTPRVIPRSRGFGRTEGGGGHHSAHPARCLAVMPSQVVQPGDGWKAA